MFDGKVSNAFRWPLSFIESRWPLTEGIQCFPEGSRCIAIISDVSRSLLIYIWHFIKSFLCTDIQTKIKQFNYCYYFERWQYSTNDALHPNLLPCSPYCILGNIGGTKSWRYIKIFKSGVKNWCNLVISLIWVSTAIDTSDNCRWYPTIILRCLDLAQSTPNLQI